MNISVKLKYRISLLCLLVAGISLSPGLVSADFILGKCSKDGYTIATINGINTTKKEARDNMKSVSINIPTFYKNEPLDFQFLYNPTHTLGIGDVFDTIDQGSSGKADDIDLLNIQNDASTEIKTQKVLLIGHSQGNFYVNNLYNRIVGTSVPQQSIGAYAVATPAAYIAGVTRGTENTDNYVTSDNDTVINKYAAMAMYSLPSNVHIPVHNADDSNGHDFLKIYMNYVPDIITTGIKASLSKLQPNNIQNPEKPCIVAPQFALLDKLQNNTLAVTDFALNVTVGVPVKAGITLVSKISQFAQSLFTPSSNLARNTGASALDAVAPQVADTPVAAPVPVVPRTPVAVVPQVVPNTPVVVDTPPKATIPEVAPPTPVVPIPEVAQPVAAVIAPVAPMVTPPVSLGGGGGGGGAPAGRGQGPTDTIPPIITLAGSTPMTIALHSTYTDLGATATDNFDGIVAVSTTGAVDTTTSGVYTLTYTASDAHHNTATATRTVTVDTLVGPVITLLGANPLILTRGDTFTDPGATALDVVDGARLVTTTGTVDTAHGGVYTLTYNSTDLVGNTTQAMRTVKVNGKLVPFVNNTITGDIAYNGNYDAWLCMFDNPTDRFLHNGMSTAPANMMRWQTPYQRTFNDNMTPLRNYRLIFGNNARAQADCTNGTYYQDYSNPFYYTTKSGISIVYGTYTPSGSSAKAITTFYLDMDFDPTVICQIAESAHTIGCTVKQIVLTRALLSPGSVLTLARLIPHIAISSGATISPNTEVVRDFTNPITYTVTAEDGTTQDYTVTTTIDTVSPSAECTDPYGTCLPYVAGVVLL